MNYLIIEDKTLTVKNSWLIWRAKKYQLDNVLDFEFNHVFRGGMALTITTKDYDIKGYLISTFNNEELDIIRTALIKTGVRFTIKPDM